MFKRKTTPVCPPGSDARKDFLITMFSENLSHARHIEIERLTYCTCITALVAGVLAFCSSINWKEQLLMYIVLLVAMLLSFFLNDRWATVFVGHMSCAKACYTELSGEQADSFEKYAFRIPRKKGFPGTKQCFDLFYLLLTVIILLALIYTVFIHRAAIGVDLHALFHGGN